MSLINTVSNPLLLNKQPSSTSPDPWALYPLHPKKDASSGPRDEMDIGTVLGGESFEEVPDGRLFTGLADGRIVQLIKNPKHKEAKEKNWTFANIARTGNWLFSRASSPTSSSPHPSYMPGEVQISPHRSFPPPPAAAWSPLFPASWLSASSSHSLLPHGLEAACGSPEAEWACGRPLALRWHAGLAVLVASDATYGLVAVQVDDGSHQEWRGVCNDACRKCVKDLGRDCVAVCLGCVGGMKKGEVRLLTDMAGGRKIHFANGLDILQHYTAAPSHSASTASSSSPGSSCLSAWNNLDGDIFFTDSSSRHPRSRVFLECYEASPGGRLLRYRPRVGTTEVVLDRLAFPNGLLFARHRWPPTLLVVELMRFRVLQYQIISEENDQEESKATRGMDQEEGERLSSVQCSGHGKVTIFVEDLPFFPDNITYARRTSTQGTYFVAASFERKGLWKLLMGSGIVGWLGRSMMAMAPYHLVTRVADRAGLVRGLLAEIEEVDEGGGAESKLGPEEGRWERKAVIGKLQRVFRYDNNAVEADKDGVWSRGLMYLSEGFLTSAGELLLGSYMPSQPVWVMENFESFRDREIQWEDKLWRNETVTKSQEKQGEPTSNEETKTLDEL
eukprot:GHVS01094301.1.p1 GENE.GHVS01094301.1~~GHVS01094301.1.p1  ORF type:complete len:705 (+),score=125.41 GHVS01094301.1:265-2115(+)